MGTSVWMAICLQNWWISRIIHPKLVLNFCSWRRWINSNYDWEFPLVLYFIIVYVYNTVYILFWISLPLYRLLKKSLLKKKQLNKKKKIFFFHSWKLIWAVYNALSFQIQNSFIFLNVKCLVPSYITNCNLSTVSYTKTQGYIFKSCKKSVYFAKNWWER